MFAAITAAFALQDMVLRRHALAAIGPYESHGKGEGYPGNKHSRHRVAMDKRAALKAKNRRRSRR